MGMCLALIFSTKVKRRIAEKSNPSIFSISSNVTRQNTILMQTCGIAFYFSIYELSRIQVTYLANYSFEFRVVMYLLRFSTICSLNFVVYFMGTKSTRRMVLETWGFAKNGKSIAPPTLTK
uniref:Uncharacterized protein n=1 Tax=Caenorhabditis japonica TaxID=281687 RepID=A0A8R1ETE0_CAEJA